MNVLRHRVPRRGSAGAKALTPSPRALADATAILTTNADAIRASLGHADTDPDLAAAGTDYLAGRETPVGAAAAVYTLAGNTRYDDRDRLAVFVDAWIAGPGPVFAAEAVVAMMSMSIMDGAAVRWTTVGVYPDSWHLEVVRRIGFRLRAFLAGVPEKVYVEVEAALAAQRVSRGDGTRVRDDGPVVRRGDRVPYPVNRLARRVATSFLAPNRIDWVSADCAEAAGIPWGEMASTLLYAVSTPAQYDMVWGRCGSWWVQYSLPVIATIVDAMGPAAAGVVMARFDSGTGEDDWRRRMLSIVAALPGDEAFRLLLDRAADPLVTPAVMEAARNRPREAMPLLAAHGSDQLLRALVTGHRRLAAEFAAEPRIAAILADVVADAPPEALPRVLEDPPWLRARTHKPVVVDGLACAEPPAVEWRPGERESALLQPMFSDWYDKGDTWEERADLLRAGSFHTHVAVLFFRLAPEALARETVRDWRPDSAYDAHAWAPDLAARFGLDALPALVALAKQKPALGAPALLPFASPEIALLMADWFGRLKAVRATAHTWLVRHAALAARALVPAALSRPGPARRGAEQGLRLLVVQGRADAVSTAAAAYGPDAAAAIDALLASDPLELLPARVPTVPAWADPAALPRIRLRQGDPLPVPAAGHVLTMLAMSRVDEPYAGLEQVRASCEPADLAGFAWGLFTLWQGVGLPPKDGWVLDAQGLLGDDETVRRLAPLIRAWPGEHGNARAVAGVDVLAAIGTDVALMQLHGIAQRVRFKALRERATEKIDEIATGLGLTTEQLADRLVPDLGLDPAGSLGLDFGPRRFTVGFDENLKPYVVDGAGKRRPALPKPGATDDPVLAPAARQQFAALKKDVRSIATGQLHRLERAMVARRRWPVAEFREFFVAHPLLIHVVRRLVLAVHDGPVDAVRVAEDRTFATIDDEPVTLPETALVSIAHPMLLGADVPRWSDVFADYEILQPFPQLGREVYESKPDALTAYTGRVVPSLNLLALERRGWHRDPAGDGAIQDRLGLRFPDGTTASIDLEPGISVWDPSDPAEQRITVTVDPEGDPLILSEVIRDVEAVLAP